MCRVGDFKDREGCYKQGQESNPGKELVKALKVNRKNNTLHGKTSAG